MALTQGTRGSNANAALDLYSVFAALLAVVPGWSEVDNFVTGTVTWRVWKSAAAQNGKGDFFVGFAYATTGATTLYLYAFERYDPVNHAFGAPCLQNTSAAGTWNLSQNSDGTYGPSGTPFALTASLGSPLGNNAQTAAGRFGAQLQASTTSYEYVAVVSAKTITGGTLISGTYSAARAGLFEATTPTTHPLPLLCQDVSASGNAGGLSRNGPVGGGSGTNIVSPWVLASSSVAGNNNTSLNGAGTVGTPSTYDLYYGPAPTFSRWYVFHAGSPANLTGTRLGLHGADILLSNTAPLSLRDTITINGSTYYLVYRSNTNSAWVADL